MCDPKDNPYSLGHVTNYMSSKNQGEPVSAFISFINTTLPPSKRTKQKHPHTHAPHS